MELEIHTPTGTTQTHVTQLPDYCPHCHYGIVPQYLFGYHNFGEVFLSFKCVRNSCSKYFLVEYERDFRGTPWIKRYVSGSPKSEVHPDIIEKISPDFLTLYKQAQASQDAGLDEICGMGFRKALEFLIKDYIIYTNPTLKTDVESKMLGPCINEYIKSPQIKDIASRAAWLGNDETHYVRKWANMDVSHLKQLIKLTTHWIDTEYLTNEMIKNMPK